MRFIIGRTGTGKTTTCLNEIKNAIENNINNVPIIYIVPEQFSFESERRLIDICGNNGIIGAQVLSFKRLAYKVFEENNIKINSISDSGKSMLIYSIMLRLDKDLQILKGVSKNLGIVNTVVDEISEFKRYNLSPESFQNLNMNNQYLNMKLHDLALIFNEYNKSIKDSYIDKNDELKLLADLLSNKDNYLNNAKIWIDEFDGFIPQELNVIKELEKKCSVTISMISDNEEFFELNNKNLNKLKSKSDEIIKLKDVLRFNNDELKHLEKNLYKVPYIKFYDKTSHIFIDEYRTIYDEIETVAKTIISKIQKEEYNDTLHFENFAILTRDIEKYKNPIKTIFKNYGIPYFFDDKKDLSLEPLMNLIFSFLDIIAHNYKYENVFSYLKTGLTNIKEDSEIDLIENYVLKWGIRGKKWEEDFTIDDKNLEAINSIRERIVVPIINFKTKFEGRKTTKEIVTSLFEFLEEIGVYENLNKYVDDFKESKDAYNLRMAQEYSQVWNYLIKLFDEMVLVIGDEQFSFEKFKSIFKVGISGYEIGVIPSTKDKVLIGDVERTRNNNIKSLFIIGVNDGSFPKSFQNEGFINDSERQILLDNGIEIAKDSNKLLKQDIFNIYKALCVPSDDLYISYTSSNLEGNVIRPSSLIKQLKTIYPNSSSVFDNEDLVVLPNASFENTIKTIYTSYNDEIPLNEKDKALIKWYDTNDKVRFENTIKGLNFTNTIEAQSRDVSKRLYGQTMNTSVSRLENYVSCPYSFYLRYGLKLRDRDVYKLATPDIGSFLHEIIDLFTKHILEENIDLRSISKDECFSIVSEITDSVLINFRNNLFSSTGKLKYLSIKLKEQVKKMIWLIVNHIISGDFDILGSEVEFGVGKEYPEIVIELNEDEKLVLSGKVDRVDIAKTEDGEFIRIIDYKTYNNALFLSNVYYGVQLQLLAYSDAISSEMTKPGGVFYLKLDDPIFSFKSKADVKDIEYSISQALRMRGLIISNVKLINAMDNKFYDESSGITYESDVISLKRDKNGKISKMPVISEEKFKALTKHMRKTIKEIGNEILSGNIKNEPLLKKNSLFACDFCPYHSACQFDTTLGNKVRRVNELTDDDVIELI